LPLGCLDNPALTLTINSASEMTPPPSRDRLVDFDYNGKLFWVSSPRDQTAASSQPTGWDNPHPPRWDKEVFSMLYEIYQFNNLAPAVSPVSTSISK
ncbi:MAG: hypothetical protein MUO24_07530, partial [Desulfobacterales bacterium]|nr:hypothetical protein [Desulfobacterales bacterium]